jgi:hypothetical protein
MLFNAFQEATLIAKLLEAAEKSSDQREIERVKKLKERCSEPVDEDDDEEYSFRAINLAQMNKKLKLFRLLRPNAEAPITDTFLRHLPDILANEPVKSLEFTQIDCDPNSKALATFLRCIPKMKSLKSFRISEGALPQSLLAALFVSNLRVIDFGVKMYPTGIPRDAYDNICLFLESYPRVEELTVSLMATSDPLRLKLFKALSSNSSMELKVMPLDISEYSANFPVSECCLRWVL